MAKYLNEFIETVKIEQRNAVKDTLKNNILKDEKNNEKSKKKYK